MPGPLLDNRPIEELPFACERRDLDAERIAAERAACVMVLRSHGVAVAQDIIDLGCTGLSMHMPVRAIHTMRENLAGTGVGLPCYVPPTRFCLAHNTIGGLERGQRQMHAAAADQISRPLTVQEAAHVHVLDFAQHLQGDTAARGALSYLRGDKALPDEVVADLTQKLAQQVEPATEQRADAPPDVLPAPAQDDQRQRQKSTASPYDESPHLPWKCTEHVTFFVACRYCLAQAVVETALSPQLLVFSAAEGRAVSLDDARDVAPHTFDETLRELDAAGATAVALFVKAGVWSRKLVRE